MKTAIVTGASKGLGFAITKELIRHNFKVYMVDIDEEVIASAKEVNGYPVVVDVRDAKTMNHEISSIIKEEKSIDLLVNNAGLGMFKLFEEHSEENYDLLFDVNVKGVFNATKAVIPAMKKQQAGTIITIGSDVSKRTIANGSVYAATKYAVRGLMGSLSQELREFGVRVTMINPGLMDTNFNSSKPGEDYKSGWLKPEVIAKTILQVYNMEDYVIVDDIMLHPKSQEYELN